MEQETLVFWRGETIQTVEIVTFVFIWHHFSWYHFILFYLLFFRKSVYCTILRYHFLIKWHMEGLLMIFKRFKELKGNVYRHIRGANVCMCVPQRLDDSQFLGWGFHVNTTVTVMMIATHGDPSVSWWETPSTDHRKSWSDSHINKTHFW